MSIVKDIAKGTAHSFLTKDGIQGFVTALTIVISVLTAANIVGVIEIRTAPSDLWVVGGTFSFPSREECEYELEITSIGEYGGSIDVIAKKINGWSFNGTFFVGDTILLGKYRMILTEINLDREKSIHFEYFALMDIKSILVGFLVILIFLTIILTWLPRENRTVTKSH